MHRITEDGRLPVEMCSVCRHQDFATGYCTCLPGNLLGRGDITQEEAYVMIGVEPPGPDGFNIPLGGRRQRGLWLRLTNRSRLRAYRSRRGHNCVHDDVTPWRMLDTGANQTRWCRGCGYTEVR